MTSKLLRSFHCNSAGGETLPPHTLNISQILPVFPLAGPSVFDVANLASFPLVIFNQGEDIFLLPVSLESQKIAHKSVEPHKFYKLAAHGMNCSPLTSEVLVLGTSIILALLGLVLCTSGGSIAHL